jgi:hypothetical protein
VAAPQETKSAALLRTGGAPLADVQLQVCDGYHARGYLSRNVDYPWLQWNF